MKTLILSLTLLVLTACADDYARKAKLAEDAGDYAAAIGLWDKVIERRPDDVAAYIDRGVDKSETGDYAGAIEDYSRAIEIDGRNTLAYFNRGLNKARNEDHIGAIEDLDKAVETKGGEFLYFEKAENPFVDTGFGFDVAMEEIRFERGFARYNAGKFRGAFDDFNFCIQKSHELSTCYYMVGLMYAENGHTDVAYEMFATAKELGNTDAQTEIDKYCEK